MNNNYNNFSQFLPMRCTWRPNLRQSLQSAPGLEIS